MPVARYEPRGMNPIGEILVDSDVPPGTVEKNTARIKRVAAGDLYFTRGAPYLSSAEFETQSAPMSALKEIFGLTVGGYYLGTNGKKLLRDITPSVSVQVSVDGGTTYRRWDGAAWAADAAGGNFSSVEVFNEQCDQFVVGQNLLNPKSLGFRVKLSTYTHTNNVVYTPILTTFYAHVEWVSRPYFDIFESAKTHLESKFKASVLRRHQLTAAEVAAKAFKVETNYTVASAGEFTAFNITQDVNRNTAIFHQYTAATNLLSLKADAVVAADDVIEFTFQGTAPVYVVRPDEMSIVSKVPAVIVTVGPSQVVQGRHSGKTTDYKLGSTKKLLRRRNTAVYRSCNLRVEMWARSAREALSSIQTLEGVLTEGLQSKATGETFNVSLAVPSQMIDYGDQSYYSGVMEFTVYYFDHVEAYEQVQAVSSILQKYGDQERVHAHTTSTSVGVTHENL